MEYRLRLATEADRPAIMAFMNTYWDSPHPLMSEGDFFAYYFEGERRRLNFALAEFDVRHESSEGIAALAGFIPANHSPKPDVWVSIWLAHPAARGAGLELMAALPSLTGCRTLACNNIRANTRPFYEFLGWTTGRMNHFYRLADKAVYALARIAEKDIPPVGGAATLHHFASAKELWQSGFVPPPRNPCKDEWYITRRYFHYPRQSYDIYGVLLPSETVPRALLATRVIPAEGTCVLRVADYIGPEELLPELGAAIDAKMRECGAEYADLYCAGLLPEVLRNTGFAERREGDANILPNYLVPPLVENTEYYYFTNRPEGFVMFKADGDQDRPRLDG